MAEISKEFKILLIIDAIVGFLYGFMFLIIPEYIRDSRGSPYFDPHFWRLFGGTCLAVGILTVLAIMKAEWENMKIAAQFGVIWLIVLSVVDIYSLATISYSTTALMYQWIDNILTFVLTVINILFYLREDKR